MIGHSRYQVSNKKAGIDNGVLENKLGIKDKKKLEEAETLLLADTYTHFFELLKDDEVKFDLSLLFSIHKYFFHTLYSWAGKVRNVDISKDGMLFASVKYIDQTLQKFELLLKKKLPNSKDNKDTISKKLTLIHNEYNAIHPFREGNGRTIRLFLDLLVVNLGYDPIDWSKTKDSDYFKACILGMSGKNELMTKIIKKGLKKSK